MHCLSKPRSLSVSTHVKSRQGEGECSLEFPSCRNVDSIFLKFFLTQHQESLQQLLTAIASSLVDPCFKRVKFPE